MTYDKAVDALVDAGLLDEADADAAIASLVASPVEFTYPAWAQALAQVGLLDRANLEAATSVMEKAGIAEATDDSPAFKEYLAGPHQQRKGVPHGRDCF